MAIKFPLTARYTISFRPTDTGLSPVFQDTLGAPQFRRMDTLVQLARPPIVEIGGGSYYFEHTWEGTDDPDIWFMCDGGPAIVTDVERYVTGRISPRDFVSGSGGGGGGGGITIG